MPSNQESLKNHTCIHLFGANGFIGKNLFLHFKNNCELKAYSRTVTSPILDSIDNNSIKIIQCDINNNLNVELSKNKKNICILSVRNIQSRAGTSLDELINEIKPYMSFFENVKEGMFDRIIFLSSGGTIYGEPEYLPIDEKHPRNPVNIYGLSRFNIENVLKNYAKKLKYTYSILRLSNPYGPFQKDSIVSVAMDKIHNNQEIEIFSNTIRDYVYIEDVCSAVELAALSTENLILNISSNTGLSVIDVVNKIENVMSKKALIKNTILDNQNIQQVNSNILSNKLALEKLNWQPLTNFEAGIKKLISSL